MGRPTNDKDIDLYLAIRKYVFVDTLALSLLEDIIQINRQYENSEDT